MDSPTLSDKKSQTPAYMSSCNSPTASNNDVEHRAKLPANNNWPPLKPNFSLQNDIALALNFENPWTKQPSFTSYTKY